MLSRIAESLYWMGRYIERADDTARLLDVHVHRMLAESATSTSARRCWRPWASSRQPGRGRGRRPVAGHRAAGLRPRQPQLGRRLAPPGSVERPGPPRDARHRGVGGHQPHPPRARRPGPGGPGPRAVPVLPLGPRPRRPDRRPDRLGRPARRRLAVPHHRPLPRAGRHDRPAARARSPTPTDASHWVGVLVVLRGQRRLPPHLRRRHHPDPGARHGPPGRPGPAPVGRVYALVQAESACARSRTAPTAAPTPPSGSLGRRPLRARLHRARRLARTSAAALDPAAGRLPPGRRAGHGRGTSAGPT